MNIHKNTRSTPIGRERLVQAVLGGQTPRPPHKPQSSAREPPGNEPVACRPKGGLA